MEAFGCIQGNSYQVPGTECMTKYNAQLYIHPAYVHTVLFRTGFSTQPGVKPSIRSALTRSHAPWRTSSEMCTPSGAGKSNLRISSANGSKIMLKPRRQGGAMVWEEGAGNVHDIYIYII